MAKASKGQNSLIVAVTALVVNGTGTLWRKTGLSVHRQLLRGCMALCTEACPHKACAVSSNVL